ncbi:MAG TPA: molybdopterin-dependent oxidoreductase [Actinomycetota bacterium]|nr:molybdopterin-dependent oxidoreductase [Actinomycetota bacterium]
MRTETIPATPGPRPGSRGRRGQGARRGALAGLLACGAALGAAELLAGLVGGQSSPPVAVGGAAIDATPEWLKEFAIRTFGERDKLALLAGMAVVLAGFAVAVGLLAVRRPRLGLAGVALLGAAGAAAALTRPGAGLLDALPSLAGAVAGSAALLALVRAGSAREPRPRAPFSDPAPGSGPRWGSGADAETPRPGLSTAPSGTATAPLGTPGAGVDRRRFLLTGALVAGGAVAAGAGGRLLARRSDVTASRAAVAIPAPASAAGPLAEGAAVELPGLSSFYTPNRDFYRVDTALVVPRITAGDWRLRVHGRVRRELELDFRELLARPLMERDITLSCVSNEVGGGYVGTARWTGVPLADLLREAGVEAGADQLVSRSADGFTIGTPTAVVLDGRDAMLAVAMNGEPLPLTHGFPVRMLVPGLYGYVSATKWLVDLELTSFGDFDPYWVRRGWARQAPVKTMSRIDTPRPLARLAAGQVAVAGVAWAQHRGIRRVEVRADGGPWRPARLAAEHSADTWRQWVWPWEATPGRHTLEVRATDGTGATQPEDRAPPFPDGATGWHSVVVNVT